jgi:hypothetical protein
LQVHFERLNRSTSTYPSCSAAHLIKTGQPQSQAIGEYREDASNILEVWEREIERIYRLYRTPRTAASEYGHIDESKWYPEG